KQSADSSQHSVISEDTENGRRTLMKREPAIAAALLKLFCSDSEYDSITGYLLEQYQAGRGSIWYCRQTLDVVCLALYSKAFRRPLVHKNRMPIGQGL